MTDASSKVVLPTDLAAEVPLGTPRDAAVRAGIAALSAGDYADASRRFNQALKLDPTNSMLHFFNGLAYQMMAAKGDSQKAPLAETAYLLALRLDPGNTLAAYQLGRLYLDNRDYANAEVYLAKAVIDVKDDADAFQALAVAAYYNRDLAMALWASNNAKRLAPKEPDVLRTAALVGTIAGLDKQAAEDRRDYASSGVPPVQLALFDERLSELRAERAAPDGPLSTVADIPGNFNSAPSFGSAPPMAAPAGPQTATGGPPASGNAAPRAWFDCGGAPGSGAPGGGSPFASPSSAFGSGNTQSDEPVPLPALPSPCRGAPAPRMALIDIVYIRTEETQTTSYGINLLQGLEFVLTGSLSRVLNAATDTSGPNLTTSGMVTLTLGDTTQAGINYSLNIANATETLDEVIARPTLVALDRQPSEFFSGDNLSIALSGQYGGNVVQEPIGVSLTVTPTFVDDDTILLSVKAARSFFEDQVQGAGDISQSISTSRNMTEANVAMKFGETLILSGLNEKQNTTGDNGVPVLRDIPGVQYLFSNATTNDFSKSVLILMTPRPPAYGDQLPLPSEPSRSADAQDLDALRGQAQAALGVTGNLNIIAHSLFTNRHYLAFRTGDVNAEHWLEERSLDRTLHEALQMLYF